MPSLNLAVPKFKIYAYCSTRVETMKTAVLPLLLESTSIALQSSIVNCQSIMLICQNIRIIVTQTKHQLNQLYVYFRVRLTKYNNMNL